MTFTFKDWRVFLRQNVTLQVLVHQLYKVHKDDVKQQCHLKCTAQKHLSQAFCISCYHEGPFAQRDLY